MAGDDVLAPKEAAKQIAAAAKDITIPPEGVSSLAKKLVEAFKTNKYSLENWKRHALNPKVADEKAIEWIFLADVLNFSFWADDPQDKCQVDLGGATYTGYWSLCAAMNRAMQEGTPILSASYYATVSAEDLEHVLRPDRGPSMPLMHHRLDNLHQAGKVLLEKYGGSFVNVVKQCGRSAQTLLKMIVTDFPSFADVAEFDGKTYAFYKRAQILIADIWACFEGEGLGEFTDIDTLTMFADYRIPQSLHYFGAMKYSDELMAFLRKGELMQTGDRYEVEIRGCSIWTVELIREECQRLCAADPEMQDKARLLNGVLIDHFLWDFRREFAGEVDAAVPMHKIRCIYY